MNKKGFSITSSLLFSAIIISTLTFTISRSNLGKKMTTQQIEQISRIQLKENYLLLTSYDELCSSIIGKMSDLKSNLTQIGKTDYTLSDKDTQILLKYLGIASAKKFETKLLKSNVTSEIIEPSEDNLEKITTTTVTTKIKTEIQQKSVTTPFLLESEIYLSLINGKLSCGPAPLEDEKKKDFCSSVGGELNEDKTECKYVIDGNEYSSYSDFVETQFEKLNLLEEDLSEYSDELQKLNNNFSSYLNEYDFCLFNTELRKLSGKYNNEDAICPSVSKQDSFLYQLQLYTEKYYENCHTNLRKSLTSCNKNFSGTALSFAYMIPETKLRYDFCHKDMSLDFNTCQSLSNATIANVFYNKYIQPLSRFKKIAQKGIYEKPVVTSIKDDTGKKHVLIQQYIRRPVFTFEGNEYLIDYNVNTFKMTSSLKSCESSMNTLFYTDSLRKYRSKDFVLGNRYLCIAKDSSTKYPKKTSVLTNKIKTSTNCNQYRSYNKLMISTNKCYVF